MLMSHHVGAMEQELRHLKEALAVLDVNKDGMIEVSILKQVVMMTGERLTEKEVETGLSAVKIHPGNKIKYEGMTSIYLRLPIYRILLYPCIRLHGNSCRYPKHSRITCPQFTFSFTSFTLDLRIVSRTSCCLVSEFAETLCQRLL